MGLAEHVARSRRTMVCIEGFTFLGILAYDGRIPVKGGARTPGNPAKDRTNG